LVTTAVFAEIVVAGLGAETWISLLILSIFGSKWIDIGAVSGWVALITILVVAAAYVLGVLIDRVADTILVTSKLAFLLRRRPVDKPANIERMRMCLLSKDNAAARFLDYQRSRVRVARATLLNLLVLLPVTVLFLLSQTNASALGVIAVAVIICAAVIVTAVAYRGIEFAYMCRLSDAYQLATDMPETRIAAAVCYRWKNRELEFAIVQTKAGHLWTFPKGHRKNETLPEAALREAREEAGIRGKIVGNRLLAYPYPPTRRGRRNDDWVAAFLVKCNETGPPGEDRVCEWCDFERACARLAENRDQRYAEAMQDALIAAEAEIELTGDVPKD
jgi:8-oxo-dGTP pyrophosphatase MutT (NUDIX family)